MKTGDRLLQKWRISKAKRWIEPGSRLLDIGCADGAIFQQLGDRISGGIGIDPDRSVTELVGNAELIPGYFPNDLPDQKPFDAITMLAVLEHIPVSQQQSLAENSARYLRPGGRLIITVPSPMVDHILFVLRKLRLIDGMSLEEHYGFSPPQTPGIFQPAGFTLLKHKRFQLGLNHLFVFQV